MKRKFIKCICGMFLFSTMSVTANASSIDGIALEDLVERYNYAISVLDDSEEGILSNIDQKDIKESINNKKDLSPNGNAKMKFSINDEYVEEIVVYMESDSDKNAKKLFVTEVVATYFAFDTSYQKNTTHLSQAAIMCQDLCNEGTIEYDTITLSTESTGDYDIFDFKYNIEQEPIIGEWKFKYLCNGDEIVTSDQLADLGYKDDGGIYFSCKENEYFLGLPSDKIMTDSWRVDTNKIFTEKYAHSYLLDEKGEIRAIIESEDDLDILHIFIGTDFLISFKREE